MIVARSQKAAVSVAVEETFDGEHPCRMCVAIQKGQEEEKEQERKLPAVKKTPEIRLTVLECFELPPSALSGEMRWTEFTFPENWRTDAPPVPPPLA